MHYNRHTLAVYPDAYPSFHFLTKIDSLLEGCSTGDRLVSVQQLSTLAADFQGTETL